jgi:hypothetical protein
MPKVVADLDKLVAFHYEHQELKKTIRNLKTQLKLSEAIIMLLN